MATVELTVTHRKTGQVKAHEAFQMDDATARLFIERIEQMLAGFGQRIRMTKTVSPEGRTTIDIETRADVAWHPPPPASPTFEQKYRRALPAPKEEL